MKTIQSFTVDHDFIDEGIYVSRIDGDVTTYDMRTRRPNCGDYMDNLTMHSLEHMFATYIRNSAIGDKIIYFGPMGCRTGFYLLVRDADNGVVLGEVKNEFSKFEEVLVSTQKRLDMAYRDLDKLITTRTRAIQRKLRDVEALPDGEDSTEMLLSEEEE